MHGIKMEKEEHWSRIPNFESYLISDMGAIFNEQFAIFMKTSFNQYGHMKITLTDHETGLRYDKSVRRLVAEVFVEPPNDLCTHVAILDGDLTNMRAINLVWRPKWFVWKYTHQLKQEQPRHFHNLRVKNLRTGFMYNSIIEAGMKEGLLFEDIWRSTYTGAEIFPFADTFKIM